MSFCRWMGLDSFMDYEEDGTAYDYNRLHVSNLFMHLVEASGSGTNRGIEAYYTELEVSRRSPVHIPGHIILTWGSPGWIPGPRYAGKRLVWYHEHLNRKDWI